MYSRVLYFTLLFCISFNSHAQGGREFWFAAPEVTSQHADRPILLRLSAFDQAAKVTISQPANASFKPITVSISANSLQTIDLTASINLIETKPADQVLKTGLFIQSTSEISAYYEVLGSDNVPRASLDYAYIKATNSDLFVLKGYSALGNKFFIPMQNFWWNQQTNSLQDAWSSFDIVATENNTHVTITTTQDIFGRAKQVPFTVILNKGETYSARSLSKSPQGRPTGSVVTSDKPIAITYKDDSIFSDKNWDLIGDQLIPIENIGTEYIVTKASVNFQNDRVFILATEKNTKMYLNNDTISLDSAINFNYHLRDSVAYIRTTAPVYVLHVSGFGHELGAAILPPIVCTGSKNTVFVRSNHEKFALTILVKAGSENAFTLNGSNQLVPADLFKEVKGTEGKWKYAQIVFPDYDEETFQNLEPQRTYTLKNTTANFHLATLNGGSITGFRYGYFSGFGSINLPPKGLFCQGDRFTIDAGQNKESYKWKFQESDLPQFSSSISVKDTGMYVVEVTKASCTFKDSIQLAYFEPIKLSILGNDTASCANVPFLIKPLNSFLTYKWQDNSTKPTFVPIATGNYLLEVSNENGCKKSDTLFFTSRNIPQPEIILQNTVEQFCNDSLVKLSLNKPFETYKWFNGETTESIFTKRTSDNVYGVAVKDAGCENSSKLVVDCTPYLYIPNIFTPNGDNANDCFRILNLDLNNWKIVISSRWGNPVFEANPYKNDWQATNIPDGIYFYVLQNLSSQEQRKGWVQVIR